MSSDEKERKEKVEIADSGRTEKFKKPSSEESPLYYGVCLFNINGQGFRSNDEALVFCDKKEALQTVKEHSGARFKVFASREDAANFSKSSCSTPRSLDLSIQDSPIIHRPAVGEKPSSFKAPRSQDMVKLRKSIERGDAEYFSKVVWENPRYLVSCGDTPAILQEGFRYNALHIAAKHNQGSMCSLVLSTLEDSAFLPKMYNDDTSQVTHQRRNFIVDLYLNMPEKGLCETPLHFACKFGCVKVAEILLRHPFCNTQCRNKYGKIPREIICERNGGAEVKRQIEACFEATYYVPILRSEDNSVQGTVGAPYCLAESVVVQATSPINSSLSVKARAGPMTSKLADVFYRRLRMSSMKFGASVRNRSEKDVRRSDFRKGLERIGRSLAQEMNVPWNEYWSFLDDWTDLASAEGLQKLESHLKDTYYKSLMENSSKGEEGDHSQILQTSDAFSPMTLLCRQLEGFHIDSSPLNTSPDTPALFASNRSCSESSYDSSSSLNNSALGSPELRSRPGFFRNQESFVFKSSTPNVSTATLSGCQKDKNQTGSNKCFDLICSYLVSFITDTVNILDNKHLALVSDSIVPIFKRYFSNQFRIHLEEISTFHNDIAKEVVRRLDEELLQQQRDIVLAFNKCDILLYQDNNDDSSSDEDQPTRNLHSQQVKLLKNSILRSHVKCVLNQIKHLMDNKKEVKCEVKCQCSWDQLIKLKNSEREKLSANGSNNRNGEDSSEDEFFTPPSSKVGSPHSSGGEVFTPDEGIRIFVEGVFLSKSDLDVQNAMKEVKIDPMLYPHIHMWNQEMMCCTKEEINSLATPICSRNLSLSGFSVQPKSEPHRRQQEISSTPLSSICEGWRSAPKRMVNTQIRPKNFYDCLQSWDEAAD